MKKIHLITIALLTLCLTACGKQETSAPASKDLPDGNYTEIGEGTVYLSTVSGTSENGNVPVVYTDSDTSMLQIGLDSSNFNGGNLSYIYVDGYLLDKIQMGDSQNTLTLQDNSLATGIHKVEIVQYENDDTASTMITYKTTSYEIKTK